MSEVTTRDYDYKALVIEQEGESFFEPDVAYEFSNGRTFDNDPNGGIYEVTP